MATRAKKTATAKKATVKKATAKKATAKKAPAKKASKREVDKLCPKMTGGAKVIEDYDAMLNQTNIGANNNKFYIIQLLKGNKKYHVWTRWGRVGETGQSSLNGPFADQESAVSEFEKKFRSKTSNAWKDRGQFKPKSGKYTLIEVEGDADEETEKKLKSLDKKLPKVKHKASALEPKLQSLIKLIFDKDMFKSAMADLDIDVKKMPLGQLSTVQVKKGFSVLEQLEEALDKTRINSKKLNDLSSQFYTVIPHSFGRNRPPAIATQEMLQAKMDMLNVLSDIETALKLEKKGGVVNTANPLDQNYLTLKTDLELMKPSDRDFKVVDKYLAATRRGSHSIVDAFRVNRHGEGKRYDAHNKLSNRKLLWHGTSVAVVAAILKSGLRIMPHSGGRVGKGIYMASEQSKSASYTGRVGRTGIMFLTEAALGKEHSIQKDNWRLKSAPSGKDSIVARGHTEPDPKKDTTLDIDGNDVVVPQGKAIKRPDYKSSYFSQSEYLVYKESQVRIRYVLRMKM